MIRIRIGQVSAITQDSPTIQYLKVFYDGLATTAINYPQLTGQAVPGDSVSLNTTATSLGLGTGGVDFVMAIEGHSREMSDQGHIMKARYTPAQVKTLSIEEDDSPAHDIMAAKCDLAGMPVAVATLHSLVAPFAVAFKLMAPHVRLAYVMTDGAALPAVFSKLLQALQKEHWVDVVITCGHAFGGDIEAVTSYSALQSAREVAGCQACIVAMGPGVVGTGTPLGTTALEQAPLLDGAAALGAHTLAIPRVSFADGRERHQGISHHTLTVLGRLTHTQTTITLPVLHHEQKSKVFEQLHSSGIVPKHTVVWEPINDVAAMLSEAQIQVTSMGRTPQEDPVFFGAGAAAGRVAASLCLR